MKKNDKLLQKFQQQEQQNFPSKKKIVVKQPSQLNISPVESIKIVHLIC